MKSSKPAIVSSAICPILIATLKCVSKYVQGGALPLAIVQKGQKFISEDRERGAVVAKPDSGQELSGHK